MTNEVPFSRLTRTAAVLGAATGVLLAIAGGIAWATGRWHWLALGEGHVPMAPLTALLLLLLGLAVLLRAVARSRRGARVAELLCTLTVLAGGAWWWVQWGLGFAFPPEDWLAPRPGMLGAIPIGRMSPLTAGCLVLVAMALLCARATAPRWQAVRSLGGWLAMAVLAVASIMVAAYALGTPLLYGGATIPMAWITSVAFVLLSGALLLSSGPDVWPLSMFLKKQAAGPAVDWSLLALFLALMAGIALVGLHFLRGRQAAARAAAHHELEAIADLKVQQIANWRKERLMDANLLRATPYAARRALDALAQPDSARTRSMFTGFLDPILGNDSYQHVILLDAELNVRLVHPAGASRTLAEPARRAAEEALRTREVVMVDLHRSPESGDIHLDFVIPLVVRREETHDHVPAAGLPASSADHSAGVLMLEVNAQGFLFPLIERWPRPSPTAETLLVRREGDDVLFLNELRHRQGTALVLRRPLSDARLPAARALRGESAVVEGMDYRGVPVVAAARAVPDTPWMLVAEVDRAELYAPLRDEALEVVALVLVLALAAVLGVTVLWRLRNEHFLRAQVVAERAHRLLAERYEHLMQQANDAIVLADEHHQILDANHRALAFYGYPLAELQAMTLPELCPPETRAEFAVESERWAVAGHAEFEALHQRKDGSVFPVEVSCRLVEIGGTPYQLGIIRNITQRKTQEAEIARLTRLYATLTQINQIIVCCQTRDGLLAEVCRVMVEFGRFKAAWIGRIQAAGQPLIEVAHHGSGADPALVMPGWHHGCGVVADTIHDGRATLCTSATADPRAACCRETLTRLGVQSCAALPLRLRGEVWGALSICSVDPEFFSGEEVRLLEEVAADVSFALDKLDQEAQRQEAEARLRFTEFAMEHLSDMVFWANEAGRLEYVNASACQALGYTREELLRMTVSEITADFPPDAWPPHWQHLKQAGWLLFETRHRDKSGRVFPVEIRANYMEFAGRALDCGFVRDISERQHAERERALLTHTIAASVNEIYLFDASTWRFRFVSEGAQKNLGYTVAQLQQMTPLDLKPEFDRAAFEELTGPLLRREQSLLCFETVHRRADHSLYPVEVRLQLFERAEDRVFLAVIMDTTKRKEAEETMASQLGELRRWYDATLGRETRVFELKHEVNELLLQAGQPIRYPSAEQGLAARRQ